MSAAIQGLENVRPTIDAVERTERLVAAAVKGVVLLWCLPFLVLGYVLTQATILLWRAILLGEALVHWLAGSTPVEHQCGHHLSFPHAGSLDLMISRHGAPR
jgi:hypothetical protein